MKMAKFLSVFLISGLLLVTSGCYGGKEVVTFDELSGKIGKDSITPVFIFAQSNFLTIDSDMMSEQFHVGNLDGTATRVDSLTALNAVYEMLLDSLLATKVDNFDLSAFPHLERDYSKLRMDFAFRVMYEDLITRKATVEDSAIQSYYDANIERFKKPEMYRARHIVIDGGSLLRGEDSLDYIGMPKEALDSVALVTISNIRERIVDGAKFDEMAMMYSLDNQTAERGGDLGYFELSQMVAPFDSTVENTVPGELSGVIKTRYGWHIVKVEDFSPEHYQPLDSVYFLVKNELLRVEHGRLGASFVDSVKLDGEVKIDSLEVIKPDSLRADSDILAVVSPQDSEFGQDVINYFEYREFIITFKKSRGITGEMSYENSVALLNQIASKYYILRATRILGYYYSEEIENWANGVITRYTVSTLRKEMFNLGEYPTEVDMRAYYDENIGDYAVERPLHVQHIIFADSGFAEHIRDQLMNGLDFWETVDEYYPGDPDIKRAAADLGFIGPGDMPAAFYKVAMGVPVGRLSHPVKTEYGYHLIKIVERISSMPFNRADSKIKATLKKARKFQIRDEYVISKVGKSLNIKWDRLADLYRKIVPPPTGNFGRI